jgi:hypothetical protein
MKERSTFHRVRSSGGWSRSLTVAADHCEAVAAPARHSKWTLAPCGSGETPTSDNGITFPISRCLLPREKLSPNERAIGSRYR